MSLTVVVILNHTLRHTLLHIKTDFYNLLLCVLFHYRTYMQNRVPNSQRYLVVGLVGLVG